MPVDERHAGLGAVELAEADRLAGLRRLALGGLLPHDAEDAGDAPDRAVRAGQLGALADRAGEHARDRQLAAMGGVEGLQHLDDGVVAFLDAETLAGLCDAGRFVADRLEQPADAVALLGRADQHRADRAAAHLLDEILEDGVAVGLDVLEQLLHQAVVVVGERLQHGEAGLGLARPVLVVHVDDLARRMLAVDEGALEREVDEAGDDAGLPDRDVAQHQRHAARRLQQFRASRGRWRRPCRSC